VGGSVIDDLRAEQDALDALLASLDAGAWSRPTPAEGWSVADTVRHLLVAERAATRSARDDTDFVGGVAGTSDPTPEDPGELLVAWREARRSTTDALAARGLDARVPWGGRRMSVRSLATARLMETWAHGLDCFAAAEATPTDTDRLVHVAWLGRQTLPYAFGVAGVEPPAPPDELRVDLLAPSGARWRFGPDRSDHVVTGSAGAWCRLVTHRLRDPAADDLRATGPLAEAALRVAKAYLG
jgi:uncharacterized protein (TIGR03084 family)